AEPGATFIYNNGSAHVLGAVLARVSGMPLRRFAEERLFQPLGIDTYRWPTDPDANPLGYGHLELRPPDLLRLGQLYLDPGRCAPAALRVSIRKWRGSRMAPPFTRRVARCILPTTPASN